MSENGQDQIEIKTPFFSSKIAGKNLTIRDIVLLLIFGLIIGSAMLSHGHAESAEKTSQALLREIRDSNKANLDAQKNIAFHQCRTACLLEQPQEKRDGQQCDRICATLRP